MQDLRVEVSAGKGARVRRLRRDGDSRDGSPLAVLPTCCESARLGGSAAAGAREARA